MEKIEKYMQDLKEWVNDTLDEPLEEMSGFFEKRLDGYEEHMLIWDKSYEIFAGLLPPECQNILDLGCGTGLELDRIWQNNPDIMVTGVDLCQDMLDKLMEKHPDKHLDLVCQDYFKYDFGYGKWDAVISFESLHHFLPELKKELYQKIYDGLESGGVFILGDYIACCSEEEEFLRNTYLEKRKKSAIPDNCFVHFDIPLVLEHEKELLQDAGFIIEKVLDDPDGTTIIKARKGNKGKQFMDYSRKISERLWNMPDKGELESHREETFIDDIIQKSHIEKELLANLDGIKTVFDGGAGCGRFSILLAKQGCEVTHFDISQPMIDKAKELAEREGVIDKITFVKGALEDLKDFKDKSFDMVISFDAPVSYTYPNQEQVISELVRICRKRIMVSVSSRLGYLPYLSNPVQKNQFILDENCNDGFVRWCIENKENAIKSFCFNKDNIMELWADGLMGGREEIAEYENGGSPWCITYTFMPDELKGILGRYGVKNIRLAGPGAYARTLPNEILVKIMNNLKQREDFLDFCYLYDSNPYVCGMGKDNLLAIGIL